MPIYIYPDRIDFTNYSLRIDSEGIRVTSPTSPAIKGEFISYGVLAYGSNFVAPPPSSPPLSGTVSGYNTGGGPPVVNTIDKFPFSTDANAVDVSDLTIARTYASGQSSHINGYHSGGGYGGPVALTRIDRFSFSSNEFAVSGGLLSSTGYFHAGQSSPTHGYVSHKSIIDKFPFAIDFASGSIIGGLVGGRYRTGGQSSGAHGYNTGGGPPVVNTIDKFSFSVDGSATNVGVLTQGRYQLSGQSSSTHGYSSGGSAPTGGGTVNTIDRFPFASDANATDVGDLFARMTNQAGQSSTTHGYTSGGGGYASANTIQKFPFATSTTNASDVADLTQGRNWPAGQQD